MAIITATRFNNLRATVDAVVGNGTANSGYGQNLASQQVSVGDLVQANDINNLFADIRTAYRHQNGGDPTAGQLQEVVAGELIFENDTTNFKGWDQYEALASNITSNRLTADTTSLQQFNSTVTKSRTSSWNGQIEHRFNMSFTSEAEARHFFNSGGTLKIATSITGGSGSKTTDWKDNILGSAGTITINYNETTKSGTEGTTTATGWFDFNVGQNYTVYSQMNGGGSGVYSENDYYIIVQKTSTSNLYVRVILNDEDAGDQTGSGAAQDEDVNGTLTASVQYQKAVNNVVGPDPAFTIATGSTL